MQVSINTTSDFLCRLDLATVISSLCKYISPDIPAQNFYHSSKQVDNQHHNDNYDILVSL